MVAVHLQTVVSPDGTLTLRDLPLLAGHVVEVLVRDRVVSSHGDAASRYPLRGTPVQYNDPFDGVAKGDWAASVALRTMEDKSSNNFLAGSDICPEL